MLGDNGYVTINREMSEAEQAKHVEAITKIVRDVLHTKDLSVGMIAPTLGLVGGTYTVGEESITFHMRIKIHSETLQVSKVETLEAE